MKAQKRQGKAPFGFLHPFCVFRKGTVTPIPLQKVQFPESHKLFWNRSLKASASFSCED